MEQEKFQQHTETEAGCYKATMLAYVSCRSSA